MPLDRVNVDNRPNGAQPFLKALTRERGPPPVGRILSTTGDYLPGEKPTRNSVLNFSPRSPWRFRYCCTPPSAAERSANTPPWAYQDYGFA